MTPAGHETAARFASLATRTLEKYPAIREEAQMELAGRLVHGNAEEAAMEAASARLAVKPARASWPMAVFAIAAFVLLGGIAGWEIRNTLPGIRLFGSALFMVGDIEPEARLGGHLNDEERDFVFACIGQDAEVLTKLERQHRLHPDHPGAYEEYARRHLQTNRTLPPDFRETWQGIDPGNGMWLYLEAVATSQEWIKGGSATDDPKLRETIGLLEQSSAGELFETHLPPLHMHRAALLGEAGDFEGEVRRMLFAVSSLGIPAHPMRAITEPVSAEAKRLSDGKEAERLKELIAVWERLIGRLGRNTSNLLEQTVLILEMTASGEQLKRSAEVLGLDEEEERIGRRLEMKSEADEIFSRRIDPKIMGAFGTEIGLILSPDFSVVPSVFEPGRRIEYAVAERALLLAAASIVLFLFAGAGIESFRRGRRVNGLADGLEPLFKPADCAWILALGIALPAFWYLVITRLTPFGCRDIGLTYYDFPPVLIQTGAGLLFALAMLVQTCRWRIVGRAGFLSLRAPLAWVGWVAAAIAALVVPYAGVVRWTGDDGQAFLRTAAATGGLPLLWLLWQGGVTLFSPGGRALGGTLLSRRLLVPLALLAALLLSCLPPLKAVERHWLIRDEITRSDPSHGGLMRMEALMVERIRGLFRERFPDEKR